MRLSKILPLTFAATFLLGQTALAASCTLNGESVPCSEMPTWFWGFTLGMGAFAIFAGIFTLWMFIDVIRNQHEKKLMWLLILFFFTFLGAIVYYFSVKRHRNESNTQMYDQKVPPTPPTGPIGV